MECYGVKHKICKAWKCVWLQMVYIWLLKCYKGFFYYILFCKLLCHRNGSLNACQIWWQIFSFSFIVFILFLTENLYLSFELERYSDFDCPVIENYVLLYFVFFFVIIFLYKIIFQLVLVLFIIDTDALQIWFVYFIFWLISGTMWRYFRYGQR